MLSEQAILIAARFFRRDSDYSRWFELVRSTLFWDKSLKTIFETLKTPWSNLKDSRGPTSLRYKKWPFIGRLVSDHSSDGTSSYLWPCWLWHCHHYLPETFFFVEQKFLLSGTYRDVPNSGAGHASSWLVTKKMFPVGNGDSVTTNMDISNYYFHLKSTRIPVYLWKVTFYTLKTSDP